MPNPFSSDCTWHIMLLPESVITPFISTGFYHGIETPEPDGGFSAGNDIAAFRIKDYSIYLSVRSAHFDAVNISERINNGDVLIGKELR